MGLGMVGSALFDPALVVATLPLESGDTLLFYSDGITEAMNRKDEEYGVERLLLFARQQAPAKTAVQLRDAIRADVRKFLGPDPPQDDQTLVVVKVE
jgi:sigma-B regulation protein RsbU (phosphoserine phosphatase)